MPDPLFEYRLTREFEYANFPKETWVFPSPNQFDVVVIGAGMAGLAAAFALKRMGISKIGIFDQSSSGYEGPWATYARMPTLRSGKDLVGPALGFPLITFRAWYESNFGVEKWNQLGKIPTLQWMEYLRWFRQILELPIKNGKKLKFIQPYSQGLSLTLDNEIITTTKLVLATGRAGFGGSKIPTFVSHLSRKYYSFANDQIDILALKGKKIGVVGGGASGFDAAAAALDAGALHVDIILRRKELPYVNKAASITYPGFSEGYYHLSDEKRWKLMEVCYRDGSPPPHEAVERIIGHPNLAFLRDIHIKNVQENSQSLVLETTKGKLVYDYLIVASGFEIDGRKQPELSFFIDQIQLWKDREAIKNLPGPNWFYRSPYLGPHFQFLEKKPGDAPYLKDIYCFNYAATLSHGLLSGDIPGISVGADRLARGIASDLFTEEWKHYYQRLEDYQTLELLPELR